MKGQFGKRQSQERAGIIDDESERDAVVLAVPSVACRVFGDADMDSQVAPLPTPEPCCYSQYLAIIGRGETPSDALADSVIQSLTAYRSLVFGVLFGIPGGVG